MSSRPQLRPNILFIVADQHRWDSVGYAGLQPVRTPNIDRIAREGMAFGQGYTPIPICCPARQALICGRRPESFGALWNYDNALPTQALPPDAYSYARDLRSAGYRTGFVGKWHVNPVHDPRSYGFDEYLESGGYGAFRAARHPQAKVGHDWFGQEDPVPVEDSHTHWLADRAIEMIERFAAPPTDGAGPQGTAEARYAVEARHAAPWHLSLDFAEPHLPCNPCRPFSTQYDPTAIEPWGSFGDTFADKPYIQKQMLLNWGYQDYGWEQWAPMVARYYGVISQMDDAIGKVLDRLEKLGILDDTIVVYTSDHGDMCGSHRMMDKHYVMYDDIVRVPFAIRWPAGIVGGGRSDSFVYPCLDLVPTILDLAGIEAGTDTLQGRSLRPLLEGAAPGDWRDSAVSTYHGQQFGLYVQRMLRERRWKYIWNPTDVDELYDLAGDPNELNNRVHDAGCSGLLADMRMRLLGELTAMGDGIVCRSPWMRRQLETGKKI